MIRVNVYFITDKGEQAEVREMQDNATLKDLIRNLQIQSPDQYIFIVNGKNRLGDYLLDDGDEVKIFIAMAGG